VIGLPAWVAGRHPRRTFLRAATLVLAAIVVFRWVLIPVRGAGISMTPTIADGELVLVNRLAYRLRSPRRADIVAVRLAGRSIVYVKRVIALPGERLRIEAGIVHVNDRPLDEPYVQRRWPWSYDTVDLGPGEYFVVGDNRGMPMDLHELGRVREERLIGVVVY
jgi:signal peptidase I